MTAMPCAEVIAVSLDVPARTAHMRIRTVDHSRAYTYAALDVGISLGMAL